MRQRLFRSTIRRLWITAMLAVCVIGGLLSVRYAAFADKSVSVPEPGQALLHAADGLDQIEVQLTFDPNAATQLHAVQTLTLTNRTGQVQSDIVLRSYTSAYLSQDTSPSAVPELFSASYGSAFSSGGLLVDQAQVDGLSVTPVWGDPEARTVLILTPDAPWLPDETRVVQLSWHAVIPCLAGRFGYADGVYALGNLFPTPAVWLEDAWDTRPVSAIGDPFLAECANWAVTLTVPTAYTPAASAYCAPEVQGNTAVYRYRAPAMRDFTLALSDRWTCAAQDEQGTAVIVYAKDRHSAAQTLKLACQALRCYSARWGEYVYPTLTLCEVSFPFSGMEYPAMILLGMDNLRKSTHLENTVAHEVAHQWWAVQVGSDAIAQPWQDESLAVYASLDFAEQYHGKKEKQVQSERYAKAARSSVAVAGSAINAFDDLGQYSTSVYYGGCGLWMALEQRMGQDALDRALADYQAACRFTIADRAALERILSAHAGMDVGPLMAEYLDLPFSK